MTKTVVRYFFNAIEGQENWLNKMASKGFRLITTTTLTYQFEDCKPSEYEYRVEFVGDKSYRELLRYRDFLAEMGFHSFSKNININYSIGKVRWRPWSGQLATSPGSINKELLILEKKKDGNPFELHTDLDDLIEYSRKIRNMYAFTSAMLVLLIVFGHASSSNLEPFTVWIKAVVAVLCVFLVFWSIRYSAQIHKYKEKRKTNE
nr:DUF2812 domain-containing protein [uncultured Caproiciproducens sp.]